MSVSFTDEGAEVMEEKGYRTAQSEMGNVYYPKEGICISDEIAVNYMDYPWISCFEVEGIEIIKDKKAEREWILEHPDMGFALEDAE